MRFRRSSNVEDEDSGKKSSPILLPMMRRNRHSVQEAKENIPPVHNDAHDSASSSPKTSRRRTMIDFFKHKSPPKVDEEGENGLARMSTQRTKSSKKSKHARSSSSYTLNDNVLNSILGPPKEQEKKKATDNFFVQQQVRADSRNASDSQAVPPFTVTEPARPLTEEELFVMFEGAPCFSILDGNQEYRPQVVLHGGSTGSNLSYSPDHKPLEHEAFATCTLGKDELQESELIPFTSHLRINSRRAGAGDPILEIPSMLSGNGSEPGTVGLEYFLQLPIADSLAAPNEAETFERRPLLTLDPEELGLREYDLVKLVNRLADAGDIYKSLKTDGTASGAPAGSTISELGQSLFTSLLVPDGLDTPRDECGPQFSLEVQIDALQEILETKGLWHDFTLVEWRIRIGQLLWTESDLVNGSWPMQNLSERDVFMLQVTLAAELLVRLKLLQARDQSDADLTTDTPPVQPRSLKVQWDLLLAETFLINMRVSASLGLDDKHEDVRTSFFSAVSFLTSEEGPQDLPAKPVFQPMNEAKQIAGLMAFAEALRWPHADSVLTQLRPGQDTTGGERPVSMVSTYATPLNSSRLLDVDDVPGTRSSYFGAMSQQNQQRPASSRMTTAQSIQLQAAANEPDGFNVGGWLSRSWLAGLVLPGEPASHFLMSTLLENSPEAIEALGDSANLYGGFVYDGKTFWSKSSCVGRVMAASSGATECMGWISSPGAPSDCPTGWVDVKVGDYPYPSTSQPRIKVHGAVARASDPFHHTPTNHLRAGDFTLPTDSPPVMGNEATSHGLSFATSDAASDASDAFTTTAHVTFSSPINPKLPHISVPLTYDVHFISSHPCYPVGTDSSSSPPSDTNDLTLYTTYTLNTPPPPAHPLHASYRFMTLPVATLLSASAEEARSRALSLPDITAENDSEDEDEEVAVLDCRGKADLELLARAWCSKVGENAIVGKVGRTCVACCIREARGLGVRVVIRI